jgi:hypothetical protein
MTTYLCVGKGRDDGGCCVVVEGGRLLPQTITHLSDDEAIAKMGHPDFMGGAPAGWQNPCLKSETWGTRFRGLFQLGAPVSRHPI